MLSDRVHNLVSELVEESQSLWIIRDKYKADSAECSK